MPVQELLDDVVNDVLIPAGRRNITIDLQNSSPERLKLHADRSLLNQALRIILDRSVKLSQRRLARDHQGLAAANGSIAIIEIEDASADLTHAQIDDIMDAGRVTPGLARYLRADHRPQDEPRHHRSPSGHIRHDVTRRRRHAVRITLPP